MKQIEQMSREELVAILKRNAELFAGIGTYFKGKKRFGELDTEENEIHIACHRSMLYLGAIGASGEDADERKEYADKLETVYGMKDTNDYFTKGATDERK